MWRKGLDSSYINTLSPGTAQLVHSWLWKSKSYSSSAALLGAWLCAACRLCLSLFICSYKYPLETIPLKGVPHHPVNDPSIYLFPHSTDDLLLPPLGSTDCKLLGQAIRLRTVKNYLNQGSHSDTITDGFLSLHFSHFHFCFHGVIQYCFVLQCFNTLCNYS